MKISKLKQRLHNNIEASKIEIYTKKSEEIYYLILEKLCTKIKSEKEIDTITVYHMESLYRDNTYDKYEYMFANVS
uniref:Uncharacterized protein n=1 Tax=viral metagenome TaxID=1070528 RepID=A0A6C0EWI9_9ZZZZ